MPTQQLIPATPEQIAALSRDLVAVGERLESQESADWLVVARAAALLDGLRLDLVGIVGGRHAVKH